MALDGARVRALLRRGETAAARDELAAYEAEGGVEWWLLRAELALFDDEPAAAGAALERARSDDVHAETERQRLAALRHLMLGELDDADAAASAASSTCLRAGAALPPSLIALRIAVRIALDDLDGARALLDRSHGGGDELGPALRALVEAAWAFRAGQLHETIASALDAESQLAVDEHASLRALAAYLRARAAHQLGALDRAERELRFAAGLCSDHGLTPVARLCDIARMLLSATRGDWDGARAAAQRLLTSPTLRPLAIAEAGWSIDDAGAVEQPWSATAALRRAERALADGELARADSDARVAEQRFREAGANYDRAFALVVRAEAQARLGEADRARRLLEASERLACAAHYRLVQVRAALVRAHLGDRAGDIDAYIAALDAASVCAGESLAAAALADARARVGLPRSCAPFAEGRLWRDVVRRLALGRPGVALVSAGECVYIAAATEWPGAADLRVDLVDRVAAAGGHTVGWPPHLLNLLALICECGERGADAETLYLRGWGASDYHPLRHRNTVYVAVTKLRNLLRNLTGASLQHDADGCYRVVGLRVSVRRLLPSHASELFGDAEAPSDAAAYALRAGISVAQARWELALRRCRGAAPSTTAAAADRPTSATRSSR